MIQLTALIVVGLYLVYEAVHRFFSPEPLHGGWIMAAAGVALLVDLITVCLLWSMSKGSLNVKAAFLHNLTDAGASVAVLIGGAAIFWLDWTWVDPVLTLGIAGYVLFMSFSLLRKTSRILMEGVPTGLSLDEVVDAIRSLDGISDVHHLHVWELDEHHRALEAHVVLSDAELDRSTSRHVLKEMLKERFNIAHSTLELEDLADRKSCQESEIIADH